MAEQNLVFNLIGKNKKLLKAVRGAKSSLESLQANANQLSQRFDKASQSLNSLGNKTGVAFASMAASIGVASKSFADFEKGFTNVLTLLDDNTIARFGNQIKSETIGVIKEFGLSIDDVNKSLFDAVSAGVKFEDSTKFLREAAVLAVGGVTQLSVATKGISSIMNAYSLEAEDAEKVSSALFSAQKKGLTTVEKLSNNIGKIAPIAKNAGVSFQDLLSVVAQLTSGGISTEEVITGLKAAINGLLKPTGEAESVLRKFNVPIGVSELRSKGLRFAIGQLAKAAEESPDSISKMITSIEAQTIVSALSADKLGNLDDILKVVNDDFGEGSSLAKGYEKQQKTLSKTLDKALASFNATKIILGEKLAPTVVKLTKFLDKMNAKIQEMSDEEVSNLVDKILNATFILGGLTIAFKTAAVALGVAKNALILYKNWAAISTTATTLFTGAINILKLAINPIGAAITVIIGALVILQQKFDILGKSINGLKNIWQNFKGSMSRGSKEISDTTKQTTDQFIFQWDDAFSKTNASWISNVDEMTGSTKKNFGDVKDESSATFGVLSMDFIESSQKIVEENNKSMGAVIENLDKVEKKSKESSEKMNENVITAFDKLKIATNKGLGVFFDSFDEAFSFGVDAVKDFRGTIEKVFTGFFDSGDFISKIKVGEKTLGEKLNKAFGGEMLGGAVGGALGGLASIGISKLFGTIFGKKRPSFNELVEDAFRKMRDDVNNILSGIGTERTRVESQLDIIRELKNTIGLSAEIPPQFLDILDATKAETVQEALTRIGDTLLGFESQERKVLSDRLQFSKDIVAAGDIFAQFSMGFSNLRESEKNLGFGKTLSSELQAIKSGSGSELDAIASRLGLNVEEFRDATKLLLDNFLVHADSINKRLSFSGVIIEANRKLIPDLTEQLASSSQFTIDQAKDNLRLLQEIAALLGKSVEEKDVIAALPAFAHGTSGLKDDTLGMFNKNEIIIPASFSKGIKSGELALVGAGSLNNGSTSNVSTVNHNSINIQAGDKDPEQVWQELRPFIEGTAIKSDFGNFSGVFQA